ncbi:DsbA family protein, partial [Candidatus Parcubacteria bacterium]|nr:DsbA family protein [Candidatus Parcubacteria bacterium]
FCKRYIDETYGRILETYGDQIRYVFRDYPLGFHAHAQETSEAAQCAFGQGSFWEYHDLLFENREEWAEETEITSILEGYAADLGLDVVEFSDCLASGEYTEEVEQDFADGQAAGVQGTPSFFINGRLLVGAQPFEAFQRIIDEELAAIEE